jgi:hypothetical protein
MAIIHVQLSPSFVVPFAIVRRPRWRSSRCHCRRPRRPPEWSRWSDPSAGFDDWRAQMRAYDSHEPGGDWP